MSNTTESELFSEFRWCYDDVAILEAFNDNNSKNLWHESSSTNTVDHQSAKLYTLPTPAAPPLTTATTTTNDTNNHHNHSANVITNPHLYEDHNLQQKLQSLVETGSKVWTYAIFWQLTDAHNVEQQFVLGWGDGCFNQKQADLNPRPISVSEADQQLRRRILRELQALITHTGDDDTPGLDTIDTEVTDTEWFFLVSMMCSFSIGVGTPGQSYATTRHVWLTGEEKLHGFNCRRAELAYRFGIRTMLCVPTQNGVVELGSTDIIDEDHAFLNFVQDFLSA